MLAGTDAHAGASKFCANLIETPCDDATFRAVDIERRDWGMMRCLFGKVRDLDLFVSDCVVCGDASTGCLDGGLIIFDLPIALPH